VRSSDRLEILHDDADLACVNKPAGLATIPGRAETDSALERLARQLGIPCAGTTDPRLRIVHRLDKDTSGVLLFAKHAAAQRHLSHQFQNNTIGKEYLALVAGRPNSSEGEIDAPIGADPTDRKRMAVVKHRGRPARTLWKLEETFRGFSLVRVLPKTGKTHQIRVHLAHIGLPLAIDPLYGAGTRAVCLSTFKRGYRAKPAYPERPLIERLTLHAEQLTLRRMSKESLTMVAPLPKDFQMVLKMLRKYAPG
jgi:23S rRNA pseudouridine955/2504/2580 synthase/23S rRNA pseudouridine1911/1915/1917 synthase